MRPSVTNVLKHYGQQYLDRFGATLSAQQKKVLRAVMACRTDQLGTVSYLCLSCGHNLTVPRSCCNRHCPACQHDETSQWCQRQLDRLLPCTYFLITFTVPPELRPVLLAHPREGYAAMMTAAADSLTAAASNERHVGAGQHGFFGVMHTWGRDLKYHPHCHFIVAGGAVGEDENGLYWKPSRANYFVPEKVLSILFRAKLRDALKAVRLFDRIPASAWQRDWVVDSVAGDGRASLKYLAPYIFRGPVADWRVTDCDWSESLDDASLILQVKPSGQRKYRQIPLTVVEFIRRWLLHVFPSRFHRVRHYGFLHSHSRYSLAEIRWLILASCGLLHYLACSVTTVAPAAGKLTCPCCGGPLLCLGYQPPSTSFDPSRCTTRGPPNVSPSFASTA